jgi:REP element-mobilizing transposase RayT
MRSEPLPASGACPLARPEVAAIVERALLHFRRERHALHAWAVLPNHAHAVVTPFERYELSGVLHSWRSFTASRINRELGRSGRLWQEESFDHLVRSARLGQEGPEVT